ncbi:MAG: hypothetical protein ACPG49_09225 [Chitinophagales bacterium]
MEYLETLARKLQELYGLPDAIVRSWKENGRIPTRYKELEVSSSFEKITDERLEYFLNHKAVNVNHIAPKYPNTFAENGIRSAWTEEEAHQVELTRQHIVNNIGKFIIEPSYKKLKKLLVGDERINGTQLLQVTDWTPKEIRKFRERLQKDAIVFQEEVDTCVAALGIFRSQIE